MEILILKLLNLLDSGKHKYKMKITILKDAAGNCLSSAHFKSIFRLKSDLNLFIFVSSHVSCKQYRPKSEAVFYGV